MKIQLILSIAACLITLASAESGMFIRLHEPNKSIQKIEKFILEYPLKSLGSLDEGFISLESLYYYQSILNATDTVVLCSAETQLKFIQNCSEFQTKNRKVIWLLEKKGSDRNREFLKLDRGFFVQEQADGIIAINTANKYDDLKILSMDYRQYIMRAED